MRLQGKVCVITGAGRGIGRSAAELFAREGATIILAEINEAAGIQAEQAIRRQGGEARFIPADISRESDVQSLFETVDHAFGRLDVLYNNASVFIRQADGPVTAITAETWDKIIAINLRGLFLCCKYAVPLLIRNGGGSVINTASSAAVMGIPNCDAYTASKGATLSLTRSMAVEFGPKKVRVNCIAPAGIATEMVKESNLDDPNFDAEYFFQRAPLGRFGTSEEVARTALFLASDESSYINGAIIRADGGITIAPIS